MEYHEKTARAFAEMAQFPLFDAIFGRRSRRFGLGMTIPDGPLAYCSKHEPLALSDLERIVLLLCGAGISGWNTGIEHTESGSSDSGCNYPVRFVGRTFASPAGVHSSELIVTDDSGTYMTQLRDLDPAGWREFDGESALHAVMDRVMSHCVKLAEGRVTVPAEPPHTASHNVWNANQPGTTLFAPVVDATQQMLDVLAIYLAMGFTPYDTRHRRLCGDLEPFFRSGLLQRERLLPLADFEQHIAASCAMEAVQMCHNMVLTLQAMGLGGWLFTGISPLSLMGAASDQGVAGLGFRFTRDPDWIMPNPVGLDGCLEALCPPYHDDMAAAVESFVSRKFGPGGAFDPARPGPYRNSPAVKARIERYSPELVELLITVSQYVHDTYGKFPGTAPSIYMRPYVQAQHIDTGFYDRFYGEDAYLESHRRHMERWHG